MTAVTAVLLGGMLLPGVSGAQPSSASSPTTGRGRPTVGGADPTLWPGGTWSPDPATYGVTTVDDVPITMSDGVVLRADIAYPADPSTGQRAPGTFPVLLAQNPYGSLIQPDPYFVERGYIYVVEDVRETTSRSPAPVTDDAQFFGPRDAQDGVDTVEYLAHDLPGSNGTVGLVGCSFLGISELMTAALLGPNSPVKAMVPACASLGYDLFFAGGIPGEDMATFPLLADVLTPGTPFVIDSGFAQQVGDSIATGGADAYDGSFWSVRDAVADAEAMVKSGIPALLWTGWQAIEAQGAVDLYSALQNAYEGRNPYGPITPNEPVTGRYQIVVGPGLHGTGLDDAFQLEWFDRWLRGVPDGIDDTATPMHLYEVDSGRWVNVPDLPVSTPDSYYLDSAGTLGTTVPGPGTATLSWAQPTVSGSTLTYDSAPLAQTTDVAGPVAATVYASSSSTNLEFVATLEDVTPNGSTTQMADGALIGSMRSVDPSRSWVAANGQIIKPYHPFTGDTYLTPGVPESFAIDMGTALYSVPAGDSLRLVISTQAPSSACDILTVLSPVLPCAPTAPQLASLTGSTDTVLTGKGYPSVLDVPLVDPYRLPATLGCSTPTSEFGAVEPMDWNGGTDGPRDTVADDLACLSLWS